MYTPGVQGRHTELWSAEGGEACVGTEVCHVDFFSRTVYGQVSSQHVRLGFHIGQELVEQEPREGKGESTLSLMHIWHL